jgi:hypothetical protein
MTPTPAGALTRPTFSPCDFIATQWNSADEKAWFANILCRFIESDFRRTLWTRRLYRRLSLCFGHIAHYADGEVMRSSCVRHWTLGLSREHYSFRWPDTLRKSSECRHW